MDLSLELDFVKTLAKKAGKTALDLRGNLQVVMKSLREGPVTNADFLIQEYLIENIRKKFPHDQIIAEENFEHAQFDLASSSRTWFIDPIDGTKGYVLGTDDFVVMIGLSIFGVARLGVIYHPTSDTLYAGINHEHKNLSVCYKICDGNIQKIPQAKIRKNDLPSLIFSKTSISPKQALLVKTLPHEKVVRLGSFGLKAMKILDFSADLHVCFSTRVKLWDTCAPAAIMLANNLVMEQIRGMPLMFNNAIHHDEALIITNFKLNETQRNIILDIANQTKN